MDRGAILSYFLFDITSPSLRPPSMRLKSYERKVDTSAQSSPGRDLFLQAASKDIGDGSADPNDLRDMFLEHWNNMSAEGKLHWEDKAMLVGSQIQVDDGSGSLSSTDSNSYSSSDVESESE